MTTAPSETPASSESPRKNEDSMTAPASYPTPLRVCCYGSSSSRTPEKYTNAAYDLGMILAKRGHTCVNGAGSGGCMAAMNQGANDGNGHIVGVIHEMFVVDGSDWLTGSSKVFTEGKHELLVASGNDLQERKRLLVEGADALVVLPGGPGTWDELWEMACARHLGLTNIPIVCVNVDGYYDTFMSILQRAHDDQLLYKKPRDIVHFEDTAEAAVLWIEAHLEEFKNLTQQKQPIKKRSSMLRKMDSNVSGSTFSVWGRMSSFFGDGQKATSEEKKFDKMIIFSNILVFTAGLSLGLLATRRTG